MGEEGGTQRDALLAKKGCRSRDVINDWWGGLGWNLQAGEVPSGLERLKPSKRFTKLQWETMISITNLKQRYTK